MIPALPPRRRRLRSLALPLLAAGALAGALGYVAHIWPAPEPFVVPRDRDPIALVPLTTDAAYLTGAGGPMCMLLLEDFVRRPNWQLTIASGFSGCTGDSVVSAITVDAEGDATWTGNGLPARPLHLTPTQLASLHAAAAFSCEPPIPDEPSYSSRFVEVHWGGAEAPARRVDASPAQLQLDAFIDDAVMTYRYRRLAERADFRATVTLEPYTVLFVDRPMTITVDGRGKLTIGIARKTITAQDLEIDALVDAIDWIEMGGPTVRTIPYNLRMALDRATFDAGMQRD